MKKRIDPATEEGIKKAVQKAFNEEEARRDAEHEEAVKRLLGHLDSFTRGGDGGSANPAP